MIIEKLLGEWLGELADCNFYALVAPKGLKSSYITYKINEYIEPEDEGIPYSASSHSVVFNVFANDFAECSVIANELLDLLNQGYTGSIARITDRDDGYDDEEHTFIISIECEITTYTTPTGESCEISRDFSGYVANTLCQIIKNDCSIPAYFSRLLYLSSTEYPKALIKNTSRENLDDFDGLEHYKNTIEIEFRLPFSECSEVQAVNLEQDILRKLNRSTVLEDGDICSELIFESTEDDFIRVGSRPIYLKTFTFSYEYLAKLEGAINNEPLNDFNEAHQTTIIGTEESQKTITLNEE